MKNTSNSQLFWDLFCAWTQGGSDEVYRDKTECFEWLKNVDDDALRTKTDEEFRKLAEEICTEYEVEKEEE